MRTKVTDTHRNRHTQRQTHTDRHTYTATDTPIAVSEILQICLNLTSNSENRLRIQSMTFEIQLVGVVSKPAFTAHRSSRLTSRCAPSSLQTNIATSISFGRNYSTAMRLQFCLPVFLKFKHYKCNFFMAKVLYIFNWWREAGNKTLKELHKLTVLRSRIIPTCARWWK